MNILCLDLEGVLIPEVWQPVAQSSGVDALQKTTRQEGRPEAGDVGNEGDAQRARGEGAKDIVLDRVAEDRVRLLCAEYLPHAPNQFDILQRVETLHAHL